MVEVLAVMVEVLVAMAVVPAATVDTILVTEEVELEAMVPAQVVTMEALHMIPATTVALAVFTNAFSAIKFPNFITLY
ncbi:hypothetical protein K7432_005801 [Basidiobolus ranarum]|uniref:Secreted protein n=1 Tax=Basidiobolus ranarum TaxID=34480 RepID=A0ABR2WW15_9FUNG